MSLVRLAIRLALANVRLALRVAPARRVRLHDVGFTARFDAGPEGIDATALAVWDELCAAHPHMCVEVDHRDEASHGYVVVRPWLPGERGEAAALMGAVPLRAAG